MKNLSRDLAFWFAIGLTGAATVGLLKVLAGRLRLPEGLEKAIGAL